jgi:nitrogen regulatory protein P-II 2
VRDGDWEADRTIELKVICEPQVADQIAQRVLEDYAPHFSVGLYFGDVAVLRPERY